MVYATCSEHAFSNTLAIFSITIDTLFNVLVHWQTWKRLLTKRNGGKNAKNRNPKT